MRGFEEAGAAWAQPEDDPGVEAPPAIGTDERRMHVRAYNYWVSLLGGRAYPSIDDVDPAALDDFGAYSVLLDFSASSEDPEISFIGRALREECGLEADIRRIRDVPGRTLLSRLTDHYLQIIANRSPVGFEAEFVNHRGDGTMYRGILMPLSSNGDAIDFIYGVINWKEVADSRTSAELSAQVDRAAAARSAGGGCAIWADGPNSEFHDDGVLVLAEDNDNFELPLWAEEGAGLADRLGLARDCAEAVRGADQRSRAALYRALGHAYDFALAAEADPEGYGEILEDAGLKAQARAPMTPVVKLVFGAGYDKTRLTEFAAALCWARREGLPAGMLAQSLEAHEGGLKGVVQAERRARRPEPKQDRSQAARASLRGAPAIGHVAIDPGEGEFLLLIARRDPAGGVAVLAPVADEAMTERAIRKAAG